MYKRRETEQNSIYNHIDGYYYQRQKRGKFSPKKMKKGVDKRERLMYNITRTIEARVRKTPVIFSPKSARNLEN